MAQDYELRDRAAKEAATKAVAALDEGYNQSTSRRNDGGRLRIALSKIDGSALPADFSFLGTAFVAALVDAARESAFFTVVGRDLSDADQKLVGAHAAFSGAVAVDGTNLMINLRAVAIDTGAVLASSTTIHALSELLKQPPPEQALKQLTSGRPRDVPAAVAALADSLHRGFTSLGRNDAFFRVAIPYFEQRTSQGTNPNLGKVMAELLGSNLSRRRPFVLVERNELDNLMREHVLVDMGVMDESTVAEFGQLLGAEGVVQGTVSEVGTNYIVTCRLVDAQSAKVLASAAVAVERAGLIALSSDSVVTRTRAGAAFRSTLLPGWGQLYNGDTLKGTLLTGAGLGSLGAAVALLGRAAKRHSRYQENTRDTAHLLEDANRDRDRANWALRGYAAAVLLAAVDAWLSGDNATSIELPDFTGGQP